MATVASQPTPLSLDEFLKQPETKPASEFINGRIYQKSMPQGKHSTLQGRLSAEINQRGMPNRAAYAFPELRCNFGDRSIVPDIAVFNWERIPFNADGEIENAFSIYPDWTIEILSPAQTPTRVIDNILFCLNQGAQLGWLVDPDERLVLVFQPHQLPTSQHVSEDVLPVLDRLGDGQLTVGELFGWLSFGGSL